jgi:hypothetical protein
MNNIIENILNSLFENYKHLAKDKDLFLKNLYNNKDQLINARKIVKDKKQILIFWDNYAKQSLLK